MRFEKDHGYEVGGSLDVLADRPGVSVALKCQLSENRKALRGVHMKLTVATREMEELRLRTKKVGEELAVPRADVRVQTSLLEEGRG